MAKVLGGFALKCSGAWPGNMVGSGIVMLLMVQHTTDWEWDLMTITGTLEEGS